MLCASQPVSRVGAFRSVYQREKTNNSLTLCDK